VNNFQTLVSVPALYYPSGFSNITLTGGTTLQSGAFQFGFSGNPSGTNTVYASTNASTPATNWTSLGVVPEVSPALYIFTDPQATNSPQRFYRVRAN
jgi:hypothetical protein